MRKILVVEDDQFFRDALSRALSSDFNVFLASDGKSAKEVLSIHSIDVVLSDIQMPGLTGIELLEWINSYKNIPVILMTGFASLSDKNQAIALAAKGILTKPFNHSDLVELLDKFVPRKTPETLITDDEHRDFCKVSIEEFVARPQIEFDVFIKLSERKIIKIGHRGDEIPRDKLCHYRQKGLKHLHILKEDFGKLVNFNLGMVSLIKDRSDISSEKKMNFMKYTAEVLLEKNFVEGINKESIREAKTFLELTLSTLIQSTDSYNLLSMLNSHCDQLYAHSLGVSLLSVMIGKRLGLESSSVLFKLSLAGLFHDIGKKEIDRTVLEKPRHLVTPTERKLIESHPRRGQEILTSIPNIPSDVIQLVFEHHEDQEGLGYPLAKLKKDQHPMSKIIQLANLFLDRCLTETKGELQTPQAAIQYLEKFYGKRIDTRCLFALKDLFS